MKMKMKKKNSENIILKASNISQDNLLSIGTCFGKFTKTKKFHLQITCLDYLAQYAEVKIIIIIIVKKVKKISRLTFKKIKKKKIA